MTRDVTPIAVEPASQAPSLGFSDPVIGSQETFRAVMMALAEPGTLHEVPSAAPACPGWSAAMTALALSLLDFETKVWLEPRAPEATRDYVRFHTAATLVDPPAKAGFAFVTQPLAMPRLAEFAQGSLDYPDTSTTLIMDVATLEVDRGWHLTGPGIADSARLTAAPLPIWLEGDLAANRARFPRGVDIIFCHGRRLCGLPRSTRVGANGPRS